MRDPRIDEYARLLVERSVAVQLGWQVSVRGTPLAVGCNRGIQRFMKNVAFDEKIDGTIHLALGNSYTFTGGTNTSAIHWDIVKDLRSGGRLYADGRLVQEDGAWLL